MRWGSIVAVASLVAVACGQFGTATTPTTATTAPTAQDANTGTAADGQQDAAFGSAVFDAAGSRRRRRRERFTFTTNAGAPLDQPVTSLTVGNRGPQLLQDSVFIEHMQVHNRQRIPERSVHARGSAAKGYFRLTRDQSSLTVANFLCGRGKITPIAVRFSTTGSGRHSPEFLRDTCGFGVKFYTEEGNFDLVALNLPVFFMRDPGRFPEMVRAVKPDPATGISTWARIWDFMVNFPESTQALILLMDDIGNPTNWREMDGHGVHTFKWFNAAGRETWVRYTIDSDQCDDPNGCGFESDAEAERNFFSYRTVDLFNAIDQRKRTSWTLFIQTLDPTNSRQMARINFDPLDPTKVWPTDILRLREVGRLFLNENPINHHLENELLAFSPARVVPGIEPSDDKLLQGRLFAYGDAQNYRLGGNHQMLQINRPKCPYFDMHFNGEMNFANDLSVPSLSTRELNYFPSFTDRSVRPAPAFPHDEQRLSGRKVREDIPEQGISDFQQIGDRYRGLPSARQGRIARRIAMSLFGEGLAVSVQQTVLGNMNQVDRGLGRAIRQALTRLENGLDLEDCGSFYRSSTPP